VAETQAAADTSTKPGKRSRGGRDAKFTKIDFVALVLSEKLFTPSAVMAYVQEKGSHLMQAFISKNQRRLPEWIQDSREWKQAPARAASEGESDWCLIQRLAGVACQCEGGQCMWLEAAKSFFARNACNLSEGHLAHCLAKIICEGPSKTTRIPLIAGPSNSAKSTILDPIDEVFGAENVQHKPDLGSTMPLVNITKPNKRFMYLDEFQCVEYASVPARKPTIPVTTMLKLFGGQFLEVQVSQSFHDGNLDCRWRRGIAITSKLTGLWEPRGPVTPEDISHLQNRVEQFTATVRLQRQDLRTVTPCKHSFSKWLVEASAAYAQGDVPPAMHGAVLPMCHGDCSVVAGFFDLMHAAAIPQESADSLHTSAMAMGAASVQELLVEDWPRLGAAWTALKPLQQRRLLSLVSSRNARI